MKYYIDTSVYLNLWQKEVSQITKEKFWEHAEMFLQMIEENNYLILYSGFIIKELIYILKEKFEEKRNMFLDRKRFRKVFANPADYEFARKLEELSNYSISFFDCVHIILTKKENAFLISRDKKLIEFAKGYCRACKPEELL